MANQIQGTVYQLDNSVYTTPSVVTFPTEDILIRAFTTSSIPQVNSIIQLYDSITSPTQFKTFLVSETTSTLNSSSNTGSISQVLATILIKNTTTLPGSGITHSFPINNISIYPTSGNGVNSIIEFNGDKYYATQTVASLNNSSNNPTINSGEVAFAGTNGQLIGDSSFTFDNTTDTLEAYNFYNAANSYYLTTFLPAGSYTLGDSGAYHFLSCDTSVGTVTITLPPQNTASGGGRVIIIKDINGNAAANNITINAPVGKTIDGGASLVISTNYGSYQLYYDGVSKWSSF